MGDNTILKTSYDEILNMLIKIIGGKEYCIKQLLPEDEYRNFISSYKTEHNDRIMEKLKNFDYIKNDKEHIKNIKEVEINSNHWNKHILNFYYYDIVYRQFFEYSIKNDTIKKIPIFEDDYIIDDTGDCIEKRNFGTSFYSKIKSGNIFWSEYTEHAEKEEKQKKDAEIANNQKYIDTMKHFKFVKKLDIDTITKLNLKEADKQYIDGAKRYNCADDIFYYEFPKINGYVTFNQTIDVLIDPAIAPKFYTYIMKSVRNT